MLLPLAPKRPSARASDDFDAATLGGADALRRTDLGRIAPVACADLLVWDLGVTHQYQVIDPVQTLMLTARGRDARTVIVDGRFAMEDRKTPGVDEAAMTVRAQAQFDGLIRRYPRVNPGASAARNNLRAELSAVDEMSVEYRAGAI